MRLYGLQYDILWEDKAANLQMLGDWLRREPPAPGSLVVLPEMFSTGFSMQVEAIAEATERLAERFLIDLARELEVTMVGGVVRRGEDGRGRNQALATREGSEICRYTKLHPFCLGAEFEHFTRGDQLGLFPWGGTSAALFICYDLRFPEIFRQAVRRGAELLIVIANWPQAREAHWLTLLQARAIENQAYVIGVNRVGDDPHLSYSGRSLIVNPRGEIVADAGNEQACFSADFDLDLVRNYRRGFPALKDLREEFLGGL